MYATALDLSIGYYHIPLDEYTQNLCTTSLPWGKFKYKQLPMGISSAPDIFQEVMNKLLGNLDYVTVYIDNILIIQKQDESDESHFEKIEVVLGRLEKRGFKATFKKPFFMQEEIEYLGYLLTRAGIQPQPKKLKLC